MPHVVLQLSLRQRGQTGAAVTRRFLVPPADLDRVRQELRASWRALGLTSHLLVLTDLPDGPEAHPDAEPLPADIQLDQLLNIRLR